MKDDRKSIDGEIVEAVKTGDGVGAEGRQGLIVRDSDRPRGKRGPAPTIRLARAGVALANGADSMGSAMVEAGYSPATARNPSENGVTPRRALDAAEVLFPPARKTLRGLRPKALEVFDRALRLAEGESPDSLHVQTASVVTKLASEIGEDDPAPEATMNRTALRRLTRRSFLRAWQAGVRYGLTYGLDAALERAQKLEAGTDKRAPRIEAMAPPRAKRKPVEQWGRGWEP